MNGPEQVWLDSSAADLNSALTELESDENSEDVTAWVNAFEATPTPPEE